MISILLQKLMVCHSSYLQTSFCSLYFIIVQLKLIHTYIHTYIHTHTHIYINIYRERERERGRGQVQVTPNVIESNVTPPNNLLKNLYFENSTVELHVLNMHANFHTNRMLFTIQFINSSFMHYFKLQKFEYIQLIDDMTIDL